MLVVSACSNPNLTKPSHPAGVGTQPAAQKVGQWLWLDSPQPHGRTRSVTVEQLSCSCQQAPSETTGSEVQGLTAQQRWQVAFERSPGQLRAHKEGAGAAGARSPQRVESRLGRVLGTSSALTWTSDETFTRGGHGLFFLPAVISR